MKKIYTPNIAFAFSNLKIPLLTAASLSLVMALTGCNKPDGTQTAGQKLDAAIDKTEKAAAEAKLQGEQSGADMKAKTEAAFAKAGDALKNATENAEVSAKSTASKVIDKVDDMAITTAISAELSKDAEIKLFRINVDTKDGFVVLKGTVPTVAVRERAAKVAKTFSGVQSVDNQLTVKPD